MNDLVLSEEEKKYIIDGARVSNNYNMLLNLSVSLRKFPILCTGPVGTLLLPPARHATGRAGGAGLPPGDHGDAGAGHGQRQCPGERGPGEGGQWRY